MGYDINDVHTRLVVAETEIIGLKKALADLERGYGSITAAIYEIKESISRQSGVMPTLSEKIERLSERLDYISAKSEAVNDKLLTKFETFEASFNNQLITASVTGVKVKIMWGAIVFLLSSLGALLIEAIKDKFGG